MDRSLDVLLGGQVHQLLAARRASAPAQRGHSEAELRDMRRVACVQAAVAFAASRPDMKLADVLTAAERLLTWVERPDSTP